MFDLLWRVFDVLSQVGPVNTRQKSHKKHTEPTNIFMGLNVSPWHCRFLQAPVWGREARCRCLLAVGSPPLLSAGVMAVSCSDKANLKHWWSVFWKPIIWECYRFSSVWQPVDLSLRKLSGQNPEWCFFSQGFDWSNQCGSPEGPRICAVYLVFL